MPSPKSSDSIVKEAREAFDAAVDHESENREAAEDDIEFARLGKQWEESVERQRQMEGRPCLTVNRLPTFIRQVVNDSRLNKPQIRVRPVDDDADVQTSDVFNGLIRHIEQVSNSGVAYDTAIDAAVTGGFGYIRLNLEYIHDDTFDTEPRIQPVENPFSVYGDPWASEPDGSDWNSAFVVDTLSMKVFEDRYPKADAIDWGSECEISDDDRKEGITVAEYWSRTEEPRKILLLSNGMVIDADEYEKNQEFLFDLQVVNERTTQRHKVMQRIMSGAAELEKSEWVGGHIPIIPIYGERVNVKGKLHLRSLIRDAKDPQTMFNYWRTASTEVVALAPKNPYIGPVGAFTTDADKWETAHSKTWSYIEYDGNIAPQRQSFAGVPAGMIQEALNASDDMKSVIGIYDAALGARSNETSGKAIMARQREGDVSTFHFIDNLSRGITYLGKQLIDIIPKIYGPGRVIRVLGEGPTAKDAKTVQLGERNYELPGQEVYDLTVGRYDLVVDAGPSFTTRREEAATQMMELIRAYPDAASVIGDLLVKNLDWPGADEIAERLEQAMGGGGESEETAKLKEDLAKMEAMFETLKADKSIEAEELKIKAYEARTDRMKVEAEAMADLRDQQLQQINQNGVFNG